MATTKQQQAILDSLLDMGFDVDVTREAVRKFLSSRRPDASPLSAQRHMQQLVEKCLEGMQPEEGFEAQAQDGNEEEQYSSESEEAGSSEVMSK